MLQSNLLIHSRAHGSPFCSDICPSFILSSKDHPFSLRQHRYLVLKTLVLIFSFLQRTLQIVSGDTVVCTFFLRRELPLLRHVSLFWHSFAISFTRTSLFFLLMFQGNESLAYLLLRSFQILHIEWSFNIWIFRWLS